MALSDAQRNAMTAELARGADVVSIARAFGCSLKEVRDVKLAILVAPKEIQPDWGPEHLQPFAVARTFVGVPWELSEAVKLAHQEYDLGICEIMTGRATTGHGDVFILYKFPRRKVDTKRRPYFSRNFNEG